MVEEAERKSPLVPVAVMYEALPVPETEKAAKLLFRVSPLLSVKYRLVPSERFEVVKEPRPTVRVPPEFERPVPRRLVKYWELMPKLPVFKLVVEAFVAKKPVVVAKVAVAFPVIVKLPITVEEA